MVGEDMDRSGDIKMRDINIQRNMDPSVWVFADDSHFPDSFHNDG